MKNPVPISWCTSDSNEQEGSPISVLPMFSSTNELFFTRAFSTGCTPSSPSLHRQGRHLLTAVLTTTPSPVQSHVEFGKCGVGLQGTANRGCPNCSNAVIADVQSVKGAVTIQELP